MFIVLGSGSETMPLLEVNGLSKEFDGLRALEEVSFVVRKGKFWESSAPMVQARRPSST